MHAVHSRICPTTTDDSTVLNSHEQKMEFGVADGLQVWPNSTVPMGVTAQRRSPAKTVLVESVYDSAQSLRLLLYKDTDG